MKDGIVNGTHFFVNPANGETVDCPGPGLARHYARQMSVGFKAPVVVHEFQLTGAIGPWRPWAAYVNGKHFRKLGKAVAA